MKGIKVLGTGSFLPDKKINNLDLYKLISNFEYERAKQSLTKKGLEVENKSKEEIFDLWVKQVSGIEERRFITEDLANDPIGANERMGVLAAQRAIEDANIDKSLIDTVIYASFTPYRLIPNASITISHELGLTNTSGYILNTACSGFLDALEAASAKILAGHSKYALVVASEVLSNVIDYGDPTTAILFGDGAGAAVITLEEDVEYSYYSVQDYSPEHICMVNGDVLKMAGGPNVQKMAVNAMYNVLVKALENLNLSLSDLDMILPHQANLRIIKQLEKKLKLEEQNKVITTIEQIGNISCATTAVSLDLYRKNKLEKYPYKENALIGMTAVGGGYTYSSIVFRV